MQENSGLVVGVQKMPHSKSALTNRRNYYHDLRNASYLCRIAGLLDCLWLEEQALFHTAVFSSSSRSRLELVNGMEDASFLILFYSQRYCIMHAEEMLRGEMWGDQRTPLGWLV